METENPQTVNYFDGDQVNIHGGQYIKNPTGPVYYGAPAPQPRSRTEESDIEDAVVIEDEPEPQKIEAEPAPEKVEAELEPEKVEPVSQPIEVLKQTNAESDEMMELLSASTPQDWCYAGIREVAKCHHYEYDYDWAAVYRIIKEKTIFKELSYNDFEKMCRESGAFSDANECPSANNVKRISITGKYPEWTVKQLDCYTRLIAIVKDFLRGYLAAKNK